MQLQKAINRFLFAKYVRDSRSITELGYVRDKCFSSPESGESRFPQARKTSSPWHFRGPARSSINDESTRFLTISGASTARFVPPASTHIIACIHARWINSGAALVYGEASYIKSVFIADPGIYRVSLINQTSQYQLAK